MKEIVPSELIGRGAFGRVHAGRLWISDLGDAVAPDGYCDEFTEIFANILDDRDDYHDRRKALRALRAFTAFEYRKGESWDAFRHESDEDGEKRFRKFLVTLQCKTRKLPADGTIDVRHDSIDYIRVVMVVIRRLYQEMCDAGLHRPDSPLDVVRWRLMTPGQKATWMKSRKYHPHFGRDYAGHRFFGRTTKTKPRMLYNAREAVVRLHQAFDVTERPQLVRDLRDIHRVNGLRYSDFGETPVLGWALMGLGDTFKCFNKFDSDNLVKEATLTPGAKARMIERLEAVPHPHDPTLTLMDRVRELLPALARDDEEGDAARTELERYHMFGRDGADRPYKYPGYRYHLRVAAVDGDVIIQTNRGPEYATSLTFRKAAISTDVQKLHRETKDPDKRKEGLQRIADKYFHKVDQTHAYANWEYHLEAIEARLENAREIDAEAATDLSTVAIEPISPRLRLPEAQAARERLRTRPKPTGDQA